MKVRLSAFADEASENFSEQIRVLREERIPMIDLRGLDGKNVSDLSEEEAKEYRALLDCGGICVWAIGSPLGKIGIRDDFEEHLCRAERTFRLAKIFGTDKVRVFSFYTDDPDGDEGEVFKRMRALQSLAESHGVTLYHENEKEIYGDTPSRCVKLLREVGGLKCAFDPANFIQCGQDAGSALAVLSEGVDYYHIKDALLATGEVVPAGEGDGQIGRLISRLQTDATLTIEPHLSAFTGYDKIDRTVLKNKFTYASPRSAFAAAAEALRKILNENGFKEENGVWTK